MCTAPDCRMYSLVTSIVLCNPRTLQWLLSADVERSYLLKEETRISSYLHGTATAPLPLDLKVRQIPSGIIMSTLTKSPLVRIVASKYIKMKSYFLLSLCLLVGRLVKERIVCGPMILLGVPVICPYAHAIHIHFSPLT